jgi:hypothetical protein
MAFNKEDHTTVTSTSLGSPVFHWEHGDGAQHFSANPITTDNGDITLVTMEELEILKPDDLKPSPSPYSGHSKDMST